MATLDQRMRAFLHDEDVAAGLGLFVMEDESCVEVSLLESWPDDIAAERSVVVAAAVQVVAIEGVSA